MTQDRDYILAIDQGTTSSRVLVFDSGGRIVATEQRELGVATPQSGWVEQDAQTIRDDVIALCRAALDRIPADKIAGIGITNQRETTVIWNRKTGRPVAPAIVWQDRRTGDICRRIARHEGMVRKKTGLVIDPYFSATKIRWILDRVDGPHDDLLFGTIDSYLLWHLTGGAVHATDISNASRTMMMNIHTHEWDADLCALLDIPMHILPRICDNVADFGTTDPQTIGAAIPIRAMAGDQQAATFGQACFEPGMIKSTYGTGCFALMNTGDAPVRSESRLLTTVAWRIGGRATYALEGSIFVAGAAVQFLRDQFGFFDHASQSEELARSVPDTDGVVFVPAFAGLGAPHWNPDVRGGILGLSRGTTRAHIVRACLDAQAFQTRDLTEAMAFDAGHAIAALRVDGGLAANDYVCRTIANETGCVVERPVNTEATVWGAAAMAFIGAGIFAGPADVADRYRRDRRFEPADGYQSGYGVWQKAVAALGRFAA